jgi:hypothetical protein
MASVIRMPEDDLKIKLASANGISDGNARRWFKD